MTSSLTTFLATHTASMTALVTLGLTHLGAALHLQVVLPSSTHSTLHAKFHAFSFAALALVRVENLDSWSFLTAHSNSAFSLAAAAMAFFSAMAASLAAPVALV